MFTEILDPDYVCKTLNTYPVYILALHIYFFPTYPNRKQTITNVILITHMSYAESVAPDQHAHPRIYTFRWLANVTKSYIKEDSVAI